MKPSRISRARILFVLFLLLCCVTEWTVLRSILSLKQGQGQEDLLRKQTRIHYSNSNSSTTTPTTTTSNNNKIEPSKAELPTESTDKGLNKTEPSKAELPTESTDKGHNDETFDKVYWPQLHQTICPEGVPNPYFMPDLFNMGRTELSIKKAPPPDFRAGPTFLPYFFDGAYGDVLYLDQRDPRNAVLFSAIWKIANNQIRAYLNRFFREHYGGAQNVTIRMDLHEQELRDLQVVQGDNSFYFEHNGVRYEKPCVFTTLRDPIGRFLSGYNEVEYRLIEKEERLENGTVVEDFEVPDPNTLPPYAQIPYNYSGNGDHPNKTKEDLLQDRFEMFVRNLLEQYGLFELWPQYVHIYPMSRIIPHLARLNLLPPSHTQNAWVLTHLQNLSDTFPRFLADRCPTLANNYRQNPLGSPEEPLFDPLPPLQKGGSHRSSTDPFGTYRASKEVWKKAGPTARALCHIHAFDYACFYNVDKTNTQQQPARPFGSEPLGASDIPSVCRDVYASELFRTTILQNRIRKLGNDNATLSYDDD